MAGRLDKQAANPAWKLLITSHNPVRACVPSCARGWACLRPLMGVRPWFSVRCAVKISITRPLFLSTWQVPASETESDSSW